MIQILFLYQTPLVGFRLFRSSTLTESLEQADSLNNIECDLLGFLRQFNVTTA